MAIVVAVAILEGGSAGEEHAEFAVVELERDFGELPGQRFDGPDWRAPRGVEERAAGFQQLVGDLALLLVIEVALGSPSVAAGVQVSPGVGGAVLLRFGWGNGVYPLEGEPVRQPGVKFRCRAGHRQVVLAPVGHNVVEGMDSRAPGGSENAAVRLVFNSPPPCACRCGRA